MPVPLLALRDSFSSVINLGNTGILFNPEHPDILAHQAVRQLNRVFPVALTEAEKLNSRAYNDFIANQKAVAKMLNKMFQMAIDERNREYFTKEEMEKHLIQLLERLKEEEFFSKLRENGELEAYYARLKDAALVERLERELALDEYIKALQEQNRILLVKRKEHIAHFVNTVIPLLDEIKIFKDLSHDEKSNLLKDAFEGALAVDKKYDVIMAKAHESANADRISEASRSTDDEYSEDLPRQREIIFAHGKPPGIEVQRRADIREVFSKRARDLFHSKGVVYSKADIDKGADHFLVHFNQEKVVVKQLDLIAEKNVINIDKAKVIKEKGVALNAKDMMFNEKDNMDNKKDMADIGRVRLNVDKGNEEDIDLLNLLDEPSHSKRSGPSRN